MTKRAAFILTIILGIGLVASCYRDNDPNLPQCKGNEVYPDPCAAHKRDAGDQ